ncbi:hypothetical protein DL89DRAFT_34386 [Linderina pennispora]|uniref:Uncharacterized protein n=1 Tax=Linderina pennispora TaxID=61395 RepID=A0A1Y1VSR3_9FUNG|nr:uncharacterized protein DL89DRAFT_34386 [Linderina pennispora]ORX64328.1 hypothetical protein DL89DRAFT_34386 [Linderina pennispora]
MPKSLLRSASSRCSSGFSFALRFASASCSSAKRHCTDKCWNRQIWMPTTWTWPAASGVNSRSTCPDPWAGITHRVGAPNLMRSVGLTRTTNATSFSSSANGNGFLQSSYKVGALVSNQQRRHVALHLHAGVVQEQTRLFASHRFCCCLYWHSRAWGTYTAE